MKIESDRNYLRPLAGKGASEQHSRLRPIALYRPRGDAERFSGFFLGQSAEEATLDDARKARLRGGKAVNRLIQVQQRLRLILVGNLLVLERDALKRTLALLREPSLGAIDENMAHGD